jgi:hypothetical protein
MELFVGRDLLVFALLIAGVVLALWVIAATRRSSQ